MQSSDVHMKVIVPFVIIVEVNMSHTVHASCYSSNNRTSSTYFSSSLYRALQYICYALNNIFFFSVFFLTKERFPKKKTKFLKTALSCFKESWPSNFFFTTKLFLFSPTMFFFKWLMCCCWVNVKSRLFFLCVRWIFFFFLHFSLPFSHLIRHKYRM